MTIKKASEDAFLKRAGLTQQGQHGLRNLVGLRQNRGTGLLQDLRARH
ncbi:hypothetical protein GA0061071_1071, partial [Kosakonia oryzendophytica]